MKLSDGSVEAVVSGPDGMVEPLIAAFHEGPPAARAEDVKLGEAAFSTQGRHHQNGQKTNLTD